MNDNNNDNKEINNTLDDRTVHDFLVYANSVILHMQRWILGTSLSTIIPEITPPTFL